MGIGIWQLVLIVFIILLFFGGKKLPEFARSLGQGIKEFKKGIGEESNEISSPSPKIESEPEAEPDKEKK